MRVVAVALLLSALTAGQTGAPVIRLEKTSGGQHVFRVSGPSNLSTESFSVYAGEAAGLPALLGASRVEGETLVFTPRFPLQPGLRYRAVLRLNGRESAQTFEIPKVTTTATTIVEHVYPTTDRLPENQLKLYLQFSAPMSRGEAWRRIHLLDESGKPVELPFLEIDQELWDPEGKRLTIFFDPGRIKRGLTPNEEVGTSLKAGRSYTFVIDREWVDAAGNILREGFKKAFQVGPADREPPDPKKWQLTAPKAGTSEPLTVEFHEPMDRALLERLLDLTTPRNVAVAGPVEIDRQETRWRFTPRQHWQPGQYFLRVETILEDLAGNSIGRAFDVDVFERVEDRIRRETISLPFELSPR